MLVLNIFMWPHYPVIPQMISFCYCRVFLTFFKVVRECRLIPLRWIDNSKVIDICFNEGKLWINIVVIDWLISYWQPTFIIIVEANAKMVSAILCMFLFSFWELSKLLLAENIAFFPELAERPWQMKVSPYSLSPWPHLSLGRKRRVRSYLLQGVCNVLSLLFIDVSCFKTSLLLKINLFSVSCQHFVWLQ